MTHNEHHTIKNVKNYPMFKLLEKNDAHSKSLILTSKNHFNHNFKYVVDDWGTTFFEINTFSVFVSSKNKGLRITEVVGS